MDLPLKFAKTKAVFARTRIAPTPSGYLHLGNILSFVITISYAHRTGARVMLRIDDMDRERYDPLFLQDIFDTLNFLELPWDEGPKDVKAFESDYSQLHRMPLYEAALSHLRDKGALFACTCSRADIARAAADSAYPGSCRGRSNLLEADSVNWRIYTDLTRHLSLNLLEDGLLMQGVLVQGQFDPGVLQDGTDNIQGGTDRITYKMAEGPGNHRFLLPANMKDFVVRKKDGYPAYQLTSLIDDMHFGVDLVIRGADLWPSTLAQHYLAAQLPGTNFGDIHFMHHPLLLDGNGQKMSKSAGATSVRYLREMGKSSAEIYNILGSMLGAGERVKDWQSLAAAVLPV